MSPRSYALFGGGDRNSAHAIVLDKLRNQYETVQRGQENSPSAEQNLDEVLEKLRELARRPNVFVKLGGLNLRVLGNDLMDRDEPPSSEELEVRWRPVVEVCIEAFGADRAMFESNFPPDKCGCSARLRGDEALCDVLRLAAKRPLVGSS